MSEKSICQRFITAFLTILTFVYLITGLIVIALTLWLRLDPTFEEMMRTNILRIDNNNAQMDEVKEKIRFGLTISFWIISGCGLAAASIGLIGICGAIFASRTILSINLVTSVTLMAIEIAIAIFIFFYKPTIEGITIRYVNLADQLADSLDDMNTITSRYKCCSMRNDSSARCTTVDQLTCTTAIWYNLEYNLILAGCFIAGIIIQQILTILLCITKIVLCV
ncbi:Tetraspanin-1 [Dirofilaria immitis]